MKTGKVIVRYITALVLTAAVLCLSAAAEIGARQSDTAVSFTVVSDSTIENQSFSLTASPDGSVSLTDKRTGAVWNSNPADRQQQTEVKGIAKMQMNSQLIVDYLVDEKNTKQATSYASCTNKKGVTVSTDKNGIRVSYKFAAEDFEIPVLYSLDGDGMTARILCGEISETGDSQITAISFLPYFGATGTSDQGYFLVPDGSGALINFNNGKASSSYQQEIYDTDGLMNIQTNKTTTQTARLPVFGIERGGDTLLSVIEGGDTVCRLYAYVSGGGNPYNYIYPQFTYRQSAVVSMLSKTWYPVDVTYISPLTAKEDFVVKYSPIESQTGGYSAMASAYREQLDLGQKTEQNKVPLYIDFYGSALVSDNILGIPVTVNQALTSFEDMQNILTQLLDDGITDVNARIRGITSAGLENSRVPTSFKPASSLGGKSGFNELSAYAAQNGITVFPDIDLINFKKPTFSLLKQLDAAKDVCKKTGVFYEFDKSNGAVKSGGEKSYVLKPAKVEKAADRFLSSYTKKTDNKAVAFSTLASFIYSDFGSDICLAADTAERFVSVMNSYSEKGIEIMLESPNAYALSLADSIISAPGTSSCYDIEDESVPFYQMVMHGRVSYSTCSVNLSSDSRAAVLKAIETGSSLMYSLSKADYSVICYDDYDELYSITADNWIDDIMDAYHEVCEATAQVSDKEIVEHKRHADGLYSTLYSDGTRIYVNYNGTAATADGHTVEAMDYLAVKGEVSI